MPWTNGIINVLIIDTANNGGIFVYSGVPQNGNLIGSWAAQAGVDQFGNAFPAGLNVSVGSISGTTFNGINFMINSSGAFFYDGTPASGNLIISLAPAPGTDSFGNTFPTGIQVGDNNMVTLAPNANNPFNITQVIAGVFQGALELTTTDVNETVSGNLGSVLLGTGTATKMSTIMTSPIGSSTSQGGAVLIESENDAGTDTAIISLGYTSSPDGNTINYIPIMTISPFTTILYSAVSGINTVTFTASGSANWTAPTGVTSVKVECWGAGGGGGGGSIANGLTNNAGGAGGGGEYALDPAIAVTPGNMYAYTVGATGTGGGINTNGSDGANSTFTGNSVTVTAHGGKGGAKGGSSTSSAGTGGAGGTGSTNATHFNGGTGGNGANGGGSNAGGGGGGAGSAGTAHAGNNGNNGTTTSGGTSVSAVTGGGNGSFGGFGSLSNAGNGTVPTIPPGGGGGGGTGFSGFTGNPGLGAAGRNGQVKLTYSTGVPDVLMSASASAITDQYGTSIPAGVQIKGSFATGDMLVVNNTSTNPSNPSVQFTATSVADRVLGINVAGDTKQRFQISSDGQVQWGSGSANVDILLFRSAANLLQLNDILGFQNIATPSAVSNVSQIYSVTGQGQMGMVNASGFAQNISGSSLGSTSTTNITGTALTNLGSINVLAGDLVAGSAHQIHASGSFSTGTSVPSSGTFGVFWNNTGTNIASISVSTLTASLSGASWSLDAEINWLAVGATGDAECAIHLYWKTGSGAVGSVVYHSTGRNNSLAATTGTNALGLTFQFGSAPTGTDFKCDAIRISRVA